PLLLDPREGFTSRLLEQVAVADQLAHPEGGHARLAGPEELARTADLEVFLGDGEAVFGSYEHLEALPGHRAETPLRQEHAGAGHPPAAYAPTELVKLGQAEALRVLDDHDRSVRHVDPDLDHRCRDQDLQQPV